MRGQIAHVAELNQELGWFNRQLFGERSEKRLVDAPG